MRDSETASAGGGPGPSVKEIAVAVREAARNGPQDVGKGLLTGYSGDKLVALLQRLPALFGPDACYLEVGVFQGLTLLSVAGANRSTATFGIDNFAYFDRDKKNKNTVLERMRAMDLDNVSLLDNDYEDALERLGDTLGHRKIGVYFVDGPHDYRSQLMCLALAKPFLHPRAVIIVDDANYAHVRQANRDFLRTHAEFRLLFEAYGAKHPGNMSQDELREAHSGWWDGVNVIVRDPEGALPYHEPPTIRSRTIYENEHIVHAARLAEFAPDSVRFTDALLSGRLAEAAWHLRSIWQARRLAHGNLRGRYKSSNTFSDGIVGERMHYVDGAAGT